MSTARANFSAPSLRRMLEWSQNRDCCTARRSARSPSRADVIGDAERLRFEDAEIALDGNPGAGALDLMLTGKLPVVSARSPSTRSISGRSCPPSRRSSRRAEPGAGIIDADFANRLNLDLRLSAAQATVGIDRAHRCRGDRTGERGAGGLRHLRRLGFRRHHTGRPALRPQGRIADRGTEVEMRLLASDVDGGAFAAAAGMTTAGAGRPRHDLRHPEGRRQQLGRAPRERQRLDLGKLRPGRAVRLRPGRAACPRKRRHAFALDEAAAEASPIDALEFKASVANGVATIERAEARSPSTGSPCGRARRSLGRTRAFRHSRAATAGGGAGGGERSRDDLPVGGPWNALVITPTSGPSARMSTGYPRCAACSSRWRWTSRRLLTIEAAMTPAATTAISSVQAALISGVTPSRTWL